MKEESMTVEEYEAFTEEVNEIRRKAREMTERWNKVRILVEEKALSVDKKPEKEKDVHPLF